MAKRYRPGRVMTALDCIELLDASESGKRTPEHNVRELRDAIRARLKFLVTRPRQRRRRG
jgi:hypothetical protein